MQHRWWLIYAGLGSAATGVYFLFDDEAVRLVLALVLLASPAAAIAGAVRLHRPAVRTPWRTAAAAVGLLIVSMVLRAATGGYGDGSLDLPSELINLAAYVLFVWALSSLIRARLPRSHATSLVDGAITAVQVGVLIHLFILDPIAHRAEVSAAEQLTLMAFPILDVMMARMAVTLLVGPGPRSLSLGLLGASMSLLLVTDLTWVAGHLSGSYQAGSPVDAGWFAAALALGTAVLHPSMRGVTDRVPEPEFALTRTHLGILIGAFFLAAVALGIEVQRHGLTPPVLLGGPLLVILTGTRASMLVGELEGAVGRLRRHDARLVSTLHDLERVEGERRQLLDQTIRAAEEERIRIAGELHDGPIQRLSVIGFALARAKRRAALGEAGAAAEIILSAQEALSREVGALRRLMSELRPPVLEEQGLEAALREHVEGFSRESGIRCEVEADWGDGLDPVQELVLYRVTQEALTNVAKHARASRVRIALRRSNGSVELSIRDDGVGFRPANLADLARNGHFGLVGMRERVEMAGGTWVVHSEEGQGTSLSVSFPRQPQMA